MIPFEDLLVRNVWLALVTSGVLYVSDYYLTVYSARRYNMGLKDHVVFEGSFELTPQFQKDIDSLRRFSPRLLLGLVLGVGLLLLIWVPAVVVLGTPQVFAVALGGFILRELAVHARHVRNIGLFRVAGVPGGMRGRVEYARWLTLRLSAVELFAFAGLFFLIYLITGSWLVLGGVLSTLVTGLQHWTGSRKLRASG